MTNLTPIGFLSGAGAGVPTLEFTGFAVDIVAGTTHTLLAVPIGAAAADRIVQCWVSARQGTSVTAVTIGGVTATLGASQNIATCASRMAYALVPTGTDATVVVTTSASSSNCGISVFRLTGVSTPTEQVVTGAASPLSITASLATNQVALAGYSSDQNNAGASVSWTNATETSDYQVQAGVLPHQASAIATASGAVQAAEAGFTGAAMNVQTWSAA